MLILTRTEDPGVNHHPLARGRDACALDRSEVNLCLVEYMSPFDPDPGSQERLVPDSCSSLFSFLPGIFF